MQEVSFSAFGLRSTATRGEVKIQEWGCDVSSAEENGLELGLQQLEPVGGPLVDPWPERGGQRKTPAVCHLSLLKVI